MKCVLIFALIWISSPAHAGDDPGGCSRKILAPTEGFIAYFGFLIDEHLIGERELGRFVEELQKGKVINPISEMQRDTEPTLHEPYQEFETYLKDSPLDQTQILQWTKIALIEKKRTRTEREERKNETKNVHQVMTFHSIPHGTFLMGEKGKEVEVELTHDIEMMNTKVTQKMWVDVMGDNPSRFRGDLDLPVESLTWWSAIVFANALSEKSGLKPAYDLKGIEWETGTSASKGTLMPKGAHAGDGGDEEIIKSVNKILSKNNPNIYKTEGYRLPTKAESEYVRKNLGRSNTSFHFGDSEEDLKKYAWFKENSPGRTHHVAGLKPLVINGKEFFDLHGLVWEWLWDIPQLKLKKGKDPQGLKTGIPRAIIGGSWNHDASFLRTTAEHNDAGEDPSYGWDGVGLRLVRTLPKK